MFRGLGKFKTKHIVIPILVIAFIMTLFVSGPFFATYGIGDEWDMDVRYTDFSYTDGSEEYSASKAATTFIDFIGNIDESVLVLGAESTIYDFDIDGDLVWEANETLTEDIFHYPNLYLEFGSFGTYDIAGERQEVQEPIEAYSELGYYVSIYKIRFMMRIAVIPSVEDSVGLMTFTDSDEDFDMELTSFPECKESAYSAELSLSLGNRTDIDIGDSASFTSIVSISTQYFQTIGGTRYDIEAEAASRYIGDTTVGVLDSGVEIMGGRGGEVHDAGNVTAELSAFLKPGFEYSGGNYILYGAGVESVFEVLIEIRENQYSNALIQLPDILLGRLPAKQTMADFQANLWIYLTLACVAVTIMIVAMRPGMLSNKKIIIGLLILPFILGILFWTLQVNVFNVQFGIG